MDVTTRWNSSLDMLGRFLEQQPAISAALMSPDVRRRENDLCTLTEDVVRCLGPMKTATLAISEEESPTMSMVAPLQFQLLNQMACTAEDTSIIKELKTAVHQNLSPRYVHLTWLCSSSSTEMHMKF